MSEKSVAQKTVPAKKPRKVKVQPSKEQLLAECTGRIEEVNQEIAELLSGQSRIAGMGIEAVSNLVQDALEDANQELSDLREEEEDLKKTSA